MKMPGELRLVCSQCQQVLVEGKSQLGVFEEQSHRSAANAAASTHSHPTRHVFLKDRSLLNSRFIVSKLDAEEAAVKKHKNKSARLYCLQGHKVGSILKYSYVKGVQADILFDGEDTSIIAGGAQSQGMPVLLREWKRSSDAASFVVQHNKSKTKDTPGGSSSNSQGGRDNSKRKHGRGASHAPSLDTTRSSLRQHQHHHASSSGSGSSGSNRSEYSRNRGRGGSAVASQPSRSTQARETKPVRPYALKDTIVRFHGLFFTENNVNEVVEMLARDNDQESRGSFLSWLSEQRMLDHLGMNEVDKLLEILASEQFIGAISESKVNKILNDVSSSLFFSSKLPEYVRAVKLQGHLIAKVIAFFGVIVQKAPHRVNAIPIEVLKNHCFQGDLVHQITELENSIARAAAIERVAVGAGAAGAGGSASTARTQEEIANIPIHPSVQDFGEDPLYVLEKNKTQYASIRELINIQFKLMRSDAIMTMREGYQDLIRSRNGRAGRFFDQDLPVYTHVVPQRVSLGQSFEAGVDVSYQAPASMLNRLDTAFLKPNSLLCLFPVLDADAYEIYDRDGYLDALEQRMRDQDSQPVIATVMSKRIERNQYQQRRVSQQVVTIVPFDPASFDISKAYVMFESPVYWPAVGPVIEALKAARDSEIAFADVLLGTMLQSRLPAYIANKPIVDVKVVLKQPDASNRAIAGNINMLGNAWIPDEATLLDPAQNRALKHILSNRVAIVSGPPGTGKTFIGVAATRIIAQHLQQGQPIVTICYTNHALDQFLESMYRYIKNIVRVGGRSQSTALASCALSQMVRERGRSHPERSREIRRIDAQLFGLRDSIDKTWKSLSSVQGATPLELASRFVPIVLQMLLENSPAGSNGVTTGFRYKNQHTAFFAWFNGTEQQDIDKYNQLVAKARSRARYVEIADSDEEESDGAVPSDESLDGFTIVGNDERGSCVADNSQTGESSDAAAAATEDDDSRIVQELREQDECELQQQNQDLLDEQFVRFDQDPGDSSGQPMGSAGDSGASANDELPQAASLRLLALLNQSTNPWDIPAKQRRELIHELAKDARSADLESLRELLAESRQLRTRRQELVDLEKLSVLRSATVIGFTSTGAAMHKNLLRNLGAKVLIIEEAAELLEAQTLSCLINPSLEHLILIGDELQLRPKVNTYRLEKDYGLDISMFERLIRAGCPHAKLQTQLRMRPEIADLVRPFYENKLIDHDRVKVYPNVAGVCSNLMFISHEQEESSSSRSKVNEHEAQFVVSLARYLAHQPQYTEQDITIISMYKGQLFNIRALLKKKGLNGIRVVSTDEYQGDENRIILLSLVRSNDEQKIGFVGIKNRIIVALSRAKEGLFILGNQQLLAQQSDDWFLVLSQLQAKGLVRNELELFCPNHHDHKKLCSLPHHIPEFGGCHEPCQHQFECGHMCPRPCHPDGERVHPHMRCQKKCSKSLPCGHTCRGKCHFPTPCECSEPVDYKFEACGHTCTTSCSSDRSLLRCQSKCGKILSCGHQCTDTCSTCQGNGGCRQCTVQLTTTCTVCLKKIEYTCGQPIVCNNQCTHSLPCGHFCPGKCGTCNGQHSSCNKQCDRKQVCGHECGGKHPCNGGDAGCKPCEKACVYRCSHGRKCRNKCMQPCIQCAEACPFSCQHSKCTKLCSEPCSVPPCEMQCSKIFECGHQCQGFCGESCPPCMRCKVESGEEDSWSCLLSLQGPSDIFSSMEGKQWIVDQDNLIYKLPCGHTFVAKEYLDRHMHTEQDNHGHNIVAFPCCPVDTCKKTVFVSRRYNAVIKRTSALMEKIKAAAVLDYERRRLQLDVGLAVRAMGFAAGHWYHCPNNHVYYVGECGGPMQLSKCPECGVAIGGQSHVPAQGNAVIANPEEFLRNGV